MRSAGRAGNRGGRAVERAGGRAGGREQPWSGARLVAEGLLPTLSAAAAAALLGADGDGRITGPDAVKFFERSGLPREMLAKVWAGADSSRRGYLDFTAFCRVRLGMSQSDFCLFLLLKIGQDEEE